MLDMVSERISDRESQTGLKQQCTIEVCVVLVILLIHNYILVQRFYQEIVFSSKLGNPK